MLKTPGNTCFIYENKYCQEIILIIVIVQSLIRIYKTIYLTYIVRKINADVGLFINIDIFKPLIRNTPRNHIIFIYLRKD